MLSGLFRQFLWRFVALFRLFWRFFGDFWCFPGFFHDSSSKCKTHTWPESGKQKIVIVQVWQLWNQNWRKYENCKIITGSSLTIVKSVWTHVWHIKNLKWISKWISTEKELNFVVAEFDNSLTKSNSASMPFQALKVEKHDKRKLMLHSIKAKQICSTFIFRNYY